MTNKWNDEDTSEVAEEVLHSLQHYVEDMIEDCAEHIKSEHTKSEREQELIEDFAEMLIDGVWSIEPDKEEPDGE